MSSECLCVVATYQLANGVLLGSVARPPKLREKQMRRLGIHSFVWTNGQTQEGLEMALDAVVTAVNSGIEQADKAMEAELEKVTGGVKIPGVV